MDKIGTWMQQLVGVRHRGKWLLARTILVDTADIVIMR